MLKPCLALLLLLVGIPVWAADYVGRVVSITDGDTVGILIDAETAMALGMPKRKKPVEIAVRLAQIDTPEKGAPYGKAAKQGLSDLVFNREVRFTDDTVDDYGRTVSTIYRGDLNVNREMVRQGYAWAYRRYMTDTALCVLENEARVARRGLWGLQSDQIIAPWEWRSRQRKRSDAPFTDYTRATISDCVRAIG